MPGAAGRRSVPSELEKALQREKETLEVQFEQCKTELNVAQKALQQASATQHRELGSMEAELRRLRGEAASSEQRADGLHRRVLELEEAVPAAKNEELVAKLRRTQEELLMQLNALQSQGVLDPLPASALEPAGALHPPPRPPSSSVASRERSKPGSRGSSASERLVVDERTKRENEQLRAQIAQLEQQLTSVGGGGGGGGDSKLFKLQIRELESYQSQLERERSELARKAATAEAQLKAMQEYVDTNLGRYQKEIVRLRQLLDGSGKLPDLSGQRSRVSSRG